VTRKACHLKHWYKLLFQLKIKNMANAAALHIATRKSRVGPMQETVTKEPVAAPATASKAAAQVGRSPVGYRSIAIEMKSQIIYTPPFCIFIR
jgi:hypothetical protein